MNWNAILGIACIVSLILPIAVILYHRYYQHRSLTALLIYYAATFVYLLMSESIVPVNKTLRISTGILNNYLDVPLMLTALVFFCPSKKRQNVIRWISYAFIGYEITVTFTVGFRPLAVVYIMAAGLPIIIGYTFYLFVKQVKFSIMHGKNYGRMIMLAAIFFSYACYSLIYYFFYIQKTPEVNDTEILYFVCTMVSACVMAVGLQLMSRRMKELQALRTTRRELAMFFNN